MTSKLRLVHEKDQQRIIFVDLNSVRDSQKGILDIYELTEEENELYVTNTMTEDKLSPELKEFLEKHQEEVIKSYKGQVIVLTELVLDEGMTDIRQLSQNDFNQLEFGLLNSLNGSLGVQNKLIARNNDLLEGILNMFGKNVQEAKGLLTKELEIRAVDITQLSDVDKKQLFFDVQSKILECGIISANNSKFTNLILSVIAEEVGVNLKTAFNRPTKELAA